MTVGRVENQYGLTSSEEAFAWELLKGTPRADAYRVCFRPKNLAREKLTQRASAVARRPHVIARLESISRSANITDIDSVTEFLRDVKSDISLFREYKNGAAVAALQRIRGQVIGALRESVSIVPELSGSDDQLVERLSKGNPELAKAVRAIIGAPDYFPSARPKGGGPPVAADAVPDDNVVWGPFPEPEQKGNAKPGR